MPWPPPGRRSARCASTPASLGCWPARCAQQLDQLGATQTRIVVSGDLDEFSIAALRAEPVDSYGVGTSLVTGSGAPTASMVYKLVEVDGMPVQKRSSHKESHGGRKEALRLSRPTGTITEEVVHPAGRPPDHRRAVPGVDDAAGPRRRGGGRARHATWPRRAELVASGLHSLPWEGLALAHGEPAIPTQQIRFRLRASRDQSDVTESAVRARAAGHRGGRARWQRTQRPAGDGHRGRAGLRNR